MTSIQRSPSAPPQKSLSVEQSSSFWLSLFFTILFFLCSADQFFGVRIHNFNFRFGQGLLFICALVSLVQLIRDRQEQKDQWHLHLETLKNWFPFFLVYALSAYFSPTAGRTFLKLGWALFNIGGAILVCLNARWTRSLGNGIIYGLLVISCFLIFQAYLIDWCGLSAPWHSPLGNAIYSPAPPWPVFGYTQSAYFFMDTEIFRPCAFYYVPSFAACALALGLCLYLSLQKDISKYKPILIGGILLYAIVLTSSRSGILGAMVAFGYAGVVFLCKKEFKPVTALVRMGLITIVFIFVFMQAPEGKKYIQYLLGPLGIGGIQSRVGNPESSEGGRLRIILEGLRTWKAHPILGNGTIPPTADMKGLGQASENTWVELLMECGALGFLAFLYAVSRTIQNAYRKNKDLVQRTLIASGLLVHFLVSLNFTGTYPRLDYWILFFFTIQILQGSDNRSKR